MSASFYSGILLTLTTVLCNAHLIQYRVNGNRTNANGFPVARIDLDISLRGNVSSDRPAPENGCSCNCCQRLGDLVEQRIANLTLLVKDIQNRNESEKYQKKHFRSCQEAKKSGFNTSGVYTVKLDDFTDPFSVYCDMTTDGGGWTVFQRRQDGSVDFYRDWDDYKNGFGYLNGEFWLGLDKIYRLTKMPQLLRIDLGDFYGNKKHAKYTNFAIGNERMKYAITLGRYSGNAGDSLLSHQGMKFSTKDSDNDIYGEHCATTNHGAWWYKYCHVSNLNGKYIEDGETTTNTRGLQWTAWKSYVMKFTEMKIRIGD